MLKLKYLDNTKKPFSSPKNAATSGSLFWEWRDQLLATQSKVTLQARPELPSMEYSPLHGILHTRESTACPGHRLSRSLSVEQTRLLRCVPCPHVILHGPQAVHSPQRSGRKERKKSHTTTYSSLSLVSNFYSGVHLKMLLDNVFEMKAKTELRAFLYDQKKFKYCRSCRINFCRPEKHHQNLECLFDIWSVYWICEVFQEFYKQNSRHRERTWGQLMYDEFVGILFCWYQLWFCFCLTNNHKAKKLHVSGELDMHNCSCSC